MIPKFANRAWEKTTTTGTGSSIALSGAVDNAHFTFAEAGVQDGDVVSYLIIDGTDVELQRRQTYTASGATLSRAATPHASKINGVAGTSQITLSGDATVILVPFAEDFDDLRRVYDTVADAQAADIPSHVSVVLTGGYTTAGDGGGALYVRSASEPIHAGKFQSADGAWWELANKIVRPQMLGAVGDGATDDTTAVQNAFAIGRPVEIVGHFLLNNKISVTGTVVAFGYGREKSKLTWGASATAVGLAATLSSQHDFASIKNIAFRRTGTDGTAIELNFSGQAGQMYNIEPRCEVIGNDIRGTTEIDQYFARGVDIIQALNINVRGNYILGGYSGAGSVTSLSASRGVYVRDGGFDNTVSLWFSENTVMYYATGLHLENQEGIWIDRNDFQVCNTGIFHINDDRKKNQVRVTNNHFSCTHTSLSINWARHIKVIGNEFSQRNETVGTTIHQLVIRDSENAVVIGNTFRKNASGDTVNGIYLGEHNQSEPTTDVTISGNIFDDLNQAINPASVTALKVGLDNNFRGTTKIGTDYAPNVWQVLASSGVASSHTGDTNETVLASVTVPGGTMGANGALRVTTIWSCTESANAKTVRVRWGGTGVDGTQVASIALTSLEVTHDQRFIMNRNNAASQIAGPNSLVNTGGWGATQSSVVTATRNTAADVSIYFTGQLTDSGETVTLQAYVVEVLHQE